MVQKCYGLDVFLQDADDFEFVMTDFDILADRILIAE